MDDKVLLKIAQGIDTFYTLTIKEKVGSNDGVLAALERLQKKRLIKQGKPGSRGSKPYLITEDGFDYVLRFIDAIDDIDSFVELSGEYFPLVFSYWKPLGDYGLQGWVLDNLRSEIPKIDVEIWGQLVAGDRDRFSHKEFIDMLYRKIYGPWLREEIWQTVVQAIPVESISNFLHNHPLIYETREHEYENNVEKIESMSRNNEVYKTKILEKKRTSE